MPFQYPRLLWARLKHQVGRRGYFLFTIALVDFYYGWSFIHPETAGQREQNRWIADVIPLVDTRTSLWVWAVAWWTVGAVCVLNAFRRSDVWGYGLACSLKVIWVAANGMAGLEGMPGSVTRCLVWGWFASCVLVVSKWPEPRNSLPEVFREIHETGEIPRAGRTDGDVES